MAFTMFWIFTCSLLATASTLEVFQNPGEQIYSAGSTAQLNCSVENTLLGNSVVYWYRQGQDGNWNFLHQVYKGSDTEGQYSGGVNEQGNVFYLQIENTKRNDSGDYYCAVKDDPTFLFGNGSRLIITDDKIGSPSLLILEPTAHDIASADTVTLICLATDMSPQWSPIQCNISEVTEVVEDVGAFNEHGSFSIRSQVSIPLKTWRSLHTFFCQVRFIPDGRSVKTIWMNTGMRDDCPKYILYIGLPSIIALALIILLLLYQRRQKRGRRGQKKLQRKHAQEPETEYVSLRLLK